MGDTEMAMRAVLLCLVAFAAAEQFGDVLSTEGINDDLSAAFGGEGGALQQKTTQDGPNCGKAEHANGLLCNAYGHDSDICSSARAHFDVYCSESSMVEEAELGEAMSTYEGRRGATYSSTAGAKQYASGANPDASGAKQPVEEVTKSVEEGAKGSDRADALNKKMAPVLQVCRDADAAAHSACDGKLAAARSNFQAHAKKYAEAKERKQKQDKAEAEKKAAASYTSGEKKDIENGKAYASAAGDLAADL